VVVLSWARYPRNVTPAVSTWDTVPRRYVVHTRVIFSCFSAMFNTPPFHRALADRRRAPWLLPSHLSPYRGISLEENAPPWNPTVAYA